MFLSLFCEGDKCFFGDRMFGEELRLERKRRVWVIIDVSYGLGIRKESVLS